MNLQPEDINKLLSGLRAAKHTIFGHLFEKHYSKVFSDTLKVVTKKQDCEDMVNEVFTCLLEKFDSYGSVAEMEAFLINEIRDRRVHYLEAKKKRKEDMQALAEQSFSPLDNSYEVLMETRIIEIIHSELEKMPSIKKEIVKQMYLHGRTATQVADKLKVDRQCVVNHKMAVLDFLRLLLIENKLT